MILTDGWFAEAQGGGREAIILMFTCVGGVRGGLAWVGGEDRHMNTLIQPG